MQVNNDLSEYEQIRLNNIQRNLEFLQQLGLYLQLYHYTINIVLISYLYY